MAPQKRGKGDQQALPPRAASAFVTLKYGKSRPQSSAVKETWNIGCHESGDGGQQENSMGDLSEGAFHGTRSHTTNPCHQSPSFAPAHPSTGSTAPKLTLRFFNKAANATADKGDSPVKAKPKSALKRERNGDGSPAPERRKKVARIDDIPQVFSLKLSFSRVGQPTDSTTGAAQSPPPPSAIRTPSIKLNFAKPSQPSPSDASSTPKTRKPKPAANGTPTSAKKRKRSQEPQDDGQAVANKRPSPQRKLTLKTKPVEGPPQPLARAPTGLRLQYKGKIKKREAGSGWDSELEDSEKDPVILDGFVLRMQPGDDCDYLQDNLAKGTIGLTRSLGGPDIRVKLFDVHGRRGVMHIRSNSYAIAMVDLPCIVEGMKSWDRKGWIKSVDICQMLLVLGPVRSDDEAKNYPLPREVDPTNMQYAHGLTPPMHYVRKRRFDKTRRTKLDDIENIERRVEALLAADAKAQRVEWSVTGHDPREDRSEQSSGEDYSGTDEESESEVEVDAEGEDEEPDDYFNAQPGAHAVVETPIYQDSPTVEVEDEDADEFARMLGDEEDEDGADASSDQVMSDGAQPSTTNLAPNAENASSFAVTSTSASPSATAGAADTPLSLDAGGSPDDDADASDEASPQDESGDISEVEEEDEEGDDEEAKEQDEALQAAKDNIAEMENKIQETWAEVHAATQGPLWKKKMRAKATALEGEVEEMRRKWGL